MNKQKLFDQALKYHNITKKEFAQKSNIPYDTVTGWKRNGSVPDFAFVLLKKIAFTENPRRHQIRLKPTSIKLTDKLTKEIQVAFWGKSYEVSYILKEVRKGNVTFVKPFFENIFYGDILKILPIKAIEKLLPTIDKLFKEQTALFWRNVVKMYREGVVTLEPYEKPKTDDPYNLLLYKLKALCDRTDTIKDLFDIYFLFKILKPINLNQMLLDLEFKFLETTGYVYNAETIINALNITRRWDIVLTGEAKMHYAMKEAIIAFQNDFANTLLLAPKELDFSYETYLKKQMEKNNCSTVDEYLSFFEENAFIEYEIKRNVCNFKK